MAIARGFVLSELCGPQSCPPGVPAARDQHCGPSIVGLLSPFPERPWTSRGPSGRSKGRGADTWSKDSPGRAPSLRLCAPGGRRPRAAGTGKAAPDASTASTGMLAFRCCRISPPRGRRPRPLSPQARGPSEAAEAGALSPASSEHRVQLPWPAFWGSSPAPTLAPGPRGQEAFRVPRRPSVPWPHTPLPLPPPEAWRKPRTQSLELPMFLGKWKGARLPGGRGSLLELFTGPAPRHRHCSQRGLP